MKPQLRAPRLLKQILELQAVESHPLEVLGHLVGDENRLDAITVTTRYEKRTRHSTIEHTDVDEILDQMLPDAHIGSWHTHPDQTPVLTRPSDHPRNTECTDFAQMHDGYYEWIIGIWPGKRKPWCFRHRVYQRFGNRVRIVKLELI